MKGDLAESASRLDHMRTLRVANIDSALAAAFTSLVSGAYIVKFIQFLGGGDFWIGIFAAIPSLIGLLQIPGAIWGRSFPFYKRFVSPGGWIWRLLYIPLTAIPFLPIPHSAALFLVLACVSLASVAIQIVSPIYNDWLAEMVPPNSRGWFFSRRNAMQAAVGSVASLAGGLIIDGFHRAGRDDLGFAVIFGLGCLFGIISAIYFEKMRDITRENPIKSNLRTGVKAMGNPFRDREFRRTLIFLGFFVIASGFAGNLFGAYAFETLNMSMTALQVTAICHAAGNIASIRMWGFFGDKYGNKPVLAILMFGIAATPLPWVFCRPGDDVYNAIILGVGHVFAGMCWGGISVCQFNLLLATARNDDRANYIGAGMALQSLMGAVAPMLGAALMSVMRPQFGEAMSYHSVFFATMGLRAVAILFLLPVKEVGSMSIKGTLLELSKISPSGVKAMRAMTRTGDEVERGEAIATVASKHFEIAREEVIQALHDPSPRVRRQAAAALAEIGGAGAADALLHVLKDHPDLVEEEVIETLGRLGQQSSVPTLCQFLESPRPLIRRAVARALGEIGGDAAGEALRKGAGQSSDPDLRRAALQGLRELEYTGASAEIAEAVLDIHPSVRVAAAEAVAELNLRAAAPNLRGGLARFSDEACSELAYALGCVGDQNDIPLILQEARRGVSRITRRRCLLGVARLLEVEPAVYRLLLLEGMARDSALIQHLETELKRTPDLAHALDLFTRDREEEALQKLAVLGGPFALMAAKPAEELFLVAACAAARQGARNRA